MERNDIEEVQAKVTEQLGPETAQTLMPEIAKALRSGQPSYPASAWLVAVVVYMHLEVTIKEGSKGKGDAGGLGAGGGYSTGAVFTDDLNALYDQTRTFFFFQTAEYFTVVFFDSDHKQPGSFQGAVIGGGVGTGGGTWGW